MRRAPRPRLTGFFDSPVRNLVLGLSYLAIVMVVATAAYMAAGWSFADAVYMVVITVYTVGYNEVHPVEGETLRVITMGLIVFGCTGVIFLTGALVQLFTANQIDKVIGQRRMNTQIDQLNQHVIVCGFGRIGVALAHALNANGAGFVVVEQSEARAAEAKERGYLCLHGDATSEPVLQAAGVTRANVLATVLPNDAMNVFITLSARAFNPRLSIIARGEEPSTESKLLQAGANKVVLPTHIGAERIAELILFDESSSLIDGLESDHGFQRGLRTFGMELETITVDPLSLAVGQTVAAIERQAKGVFFVVQINRRDGGMRSDPPPSAIVHEGDGLVLMGRANRAETVTALFEARTRSGGRG